MALAREHTDLIVMQNGDRLRGEIKSLDAGVLKVDLDYADGAVSISWLKVARVESTQLFLIHTQDGSVFSGTLGTAESPAKAVIIQITDEVKGTVPIERSELTNLGQTSESFLQRLSGNINLGATYSKGNSTTQYNLGSGLSYKAERWITNAAFNSNLSSSTGAQVSHRHQFDASIYRLMKRNNYFYSAFGGFLQSSVQGIDLQTDLGAGIGHYFFNSNRFRFSVIGGLLGQTTSYVPALVPVSRQNVFAGAVRSELDMFVFKKTNLAVISMVVPALSDRGRVYNNINASYYLKLFSDLSWNLSFYGNWDTRPPPPFVGSDYGYSTGLSWSFHK